MDICGAMWTDESEPCELGSTTDHECYNMPDCPGTPHMCACEVES